MDFKEQYGPWALVTGASSGLGEEFARQLAERGLNLVLTARSEARLRELSLSLEQKYQIQTRVVRIDLSEPDAVDALYVRCSDLDIGLVVSNAGATNMCSFMDFGLDEVRRGIQLNVTAHADVARYYGESILTRRNGRGGLLFMSSVVALQGAPYLSQYSASKAYVLNLAEALHYENKRKGLHVTAVAPGPLDTPMLKIIPSVRSIFRQSRLSVLTAEFVVDGALNALHDNRVLYIPGRFMHLQFGVLRRYFFSREANVNFWGKAIKRYMKVLINSPLARSQQ